MGGYLPPLAPLAGEAEASHYEPLPPRMAVLTLDSVTFGHGGPPLLDDVTLRVEPGERIALLGRNGAGKSTLLRLLAGDLEPESGRVEVPAGVRVARLIQEVPSGEPGTVHELVAAGARRRVGEEAWEADVRADRVIDEVGLDPHAPFAELSSGRKRRALLARTLAAGPDVLLLDEPTNHLDVESILWLEQFLARFPGTLAFVTHDREFLRRLATRIVELDRGHVSAWECDYDTFLQRRAAELEVERQQAAEFDRKLAKEEVWIRQGIKARRTRNEGRVRALEALRRRRAARRERTGTTKAVLQEAERSGRLVIKAEKVSFAYDPDEPAVVQDLSVTLMRGDKLGLLGPNGCGKTTLLKLLLGDLTPTAGTVRHGTNLQVAFFDQLREQIDESKTVRENVAGGADHVEVGGVRKHVMGYLADFLFPSDQANRSARFLSGGERNRLLLARLFTTPSNVLVLDEPTNDLDAETLELLEGLLVEYGGTVLLVSHDRAFLDNVTTSVLAHEGGGEFREYDGGYADWRRATDLRDAAESKATADITAKPAAPAAKAKLSFKEQRELDGLPDRMERLEAEQAELQSRMADPTFFQQPKPEIAAATARLETIGKELEAAFAWWEELEGRA